MSENSVTKVLSFIHDEIKIYETLLEQHSKAESILHVLLVSNLGDYPLEKLHNTLHTVSDIIEECQEIADQRMNKLLEALERFKNEPPSPPAPPDNSAIH